MTRDLEETLEELGEGYRPVVDRLLAAYRPSEPSEDYSSGRQPSIRMAGWGVAMLSAAALLVFLGFGLVFRGAAPAKVYTVRASDAAHEYQLAVIRDDRAVQEMIRTQRPDGGWGNDFLTRQNAAALRLCPDENAKIAYRKAMRNLRLRGAHR